MPNLLTKIGGVGGISAAFEVYDDGSAYLKSASGSTILTLTAAGLLTVASVGAVPVTDRLVDATLTRTADGTGGATDVLVTLQLKDQAGNNVTSARQVLIVASSAQAAAFAPSSSVTFTSATTGTIKIGASNAGYALIETNSSGAFACTCRNTADQTLYLMTSTAFAVAAADVAKVSVIRAANQVTMVWSA